MSSRLRGCSRYSLPGPLTLWAVNLGGACPTKGEKSFKVGRMWAKGKEGKVVALFVLFFVFFFLFLCCFDCFDGFRCCGCCDSSDCLIYYSCLICFSCCLLYWLYLSLWLLYAVSCIWCALVCCHVCCVIIFVFQYIFQYLYLPYFFILVMPRRLSSVSDSGLSRSVSTL